MAKSNDQKRSTGSALQPAAKDFSMNLSDPSQIPAYVEQINAKLRELQGNNNEEARIDKPLGNFGVIKNVTTAESLVHAYSYITSKARRYEELAPHFREVSKVKVPPFKEEGFTLEQWQKEIDLQYRIVVNQKEIEKFTKYRDAMTELMSEEDKKRAKLQQLSEMLAEDAEG